MVGPRSLGLHQSRVQVGSNLWSETVDNVDWDRLGSIIIPGGFERQMGADWRQEEGRNETTRF